METFVNIPMRGALPRLEFLPKELPVDNAVRIEIEDGVPIFKASATVQNRIEALVSKQRRSQISEEEERELDRYEEIDDYLSFLNRVVRNLMVAENQGE
jgi:hypothetical protein